MALIFGPMFHFNSINVCGLFCRTFEISKNPTKTNRMASKFGESDGQATSPMREIRKHSCKNGRWNTRHKDCNATWLIPKFTNLDSLPLLFGSCSAFLRTVQMLRSQVNCFPRKITDQKCKNLTLYSNFCRTREVLCNRLGYSEAQNNSFVC